MMIMKCPKCLEIDHPRGAVFCHSCGEKLPWHTTNQFARHLRWHGNGVPRPNGNQHSKPVRQHHKYLGNMAASWQRLLTNKNPEWLYKKTCHLLGVRPGSCLNGLKWGQIARYLLLAAVIIENLVLSIIEYPLEKPWGQMTIFLVNITTVILTTCTCISANIYNMYKNKNGIWRLYYNWLHFFLSAAIPLMGLLLVGTFQNFLTLTMEFLISGFLLLMDSGTIEALIDNE